MQLIKHQKKKNSILGQILPGNGTIFGITCITGKEVVAYSESGPRISDPRTQSALGLPGPVTWVRGLPARGPHPPIQDMTRVRGLPARGPNHP